MTATVIGPAATIALSATAPRAWVQIIKTGTFFSQRYGTFEITSADLKQMLSNFKTVTPMAPTQLPVDYDHLSMDPQKPGDGKAAGWIEDLELRNGDRELWARVEFTEPAAQAIRAKEYRFVSPSFVRDYVCKTGARVGATLLAVAITNQPFLEGMAAVTLSAATGRTTMEVGQRVSVKAEINPTFDGQAFEIAEVVGAGDNAFAKLKDEAGQPVGWFRVTELEPARAVIDAVAHVLSMAKALQATEPSLSLRDALTRVGLQSAVVEPSERPNSNRAGARLTALAHERASERKIPFADAAREILAEQPELASDWQRSGTGR